MSYFGILLLFILPPIVILGLMQWRKTTGHGRKLVFALVIIAVLYTTPWDNYLVATKVWWYDPNLVTRMTLGWVPIEEYTFFVLQTLMTSLFYLFLRERTKTNFSHSHNIQLSFSLLLVFVIWLGSVLILVVNWRAATYLGLELVWALVPIMVQLGFGADLLRANWRLVFASIFLPTLYLSAVDWFAISSGTWTINPEKSLNIMIVGRLPVEEVIFFALTNILVVFGLHLGLHPQSIDRVPKILRQRLGLVKSK